MILTNSGVLKLMQRIKSYIASQLNTKAPSVHTHTISEIDDLASQLGGGYTKSEVDTLLNDYIPKSGTNALSGNLVPASDNAIDIGSSGNNIKELYSKNIYISGSGNGLRMNNSSASMNISVAFGAAIDLCGKDYTYGNNQGKFILTAVDGNGYRALAGAPNGTLTWNGQPIQYTSDARLKQQISKIDNALLDAWEDVELSQFKYNNAVNEKGTKARLHTGYVVQQIDEACKSHNVDISEYGLYCHEEYPEETREVEHEDGTKTIEVVRPASEHYSLRYTETLVVECAYLRKKNKELENTVLNLQTEIADLKSVIAELKTTVQGNQKS